MDDAALIDHALALILDDPRIHNLAGIETEKRLGRGRLNDADEDEQWWETYPPSSATCSRPCGPKSPREINDPWLGPLRP
jgi:hypothetical protein